MSRAVNAMPSSETPKERRSQTVSRVKRRGRPTATAGLLPMLERLLADYPDATGSELLASLRALGVSCRASTFYRLKAELQNDRPAQPGDVVHTGGGATVRMEGGARRDVRFVLSERVGSGACSVVWSGFEPELLLRAFARHYQATGGTPTYAYLCGLPELPADEDFVRVMAELRIRVAARAVPRAGAVAEVRRLLEGSPYPDTQHARAAVERWASARTSASVPASAGRAVRLEDIVYRRSRVVMGTNAAGHVTVGGARYPVGPGRKDAAALIELRESTVRIEIEGEVIELARYPEPSDEVP